MSNELTPTQRVEQCLEEFTTKQDGILTKTNYVHHSIARKLAQELETAKSAFYCANEYVNELRQQLAALQKDNEILHRRVAEYQPYADAAMKGSE